VSFQYVVGADEIIEQLIIQCWLFQARGGNCTEARRQAELALERLLSKGLPYENGPHGLRLDPYAAANMIKTRAGELDDDGWAAWQQTTHLNAVSLPPEPHLYEFSMRREWHSYAKSPGRPVVLRIPLPSRDTQRGPVIVEMVEAGKFVAEIRETPGRLEIRLDSAPLDGPVVVDIRVRFVSGDTGDPLTLAAPLGAQTAAGEQVWLRDREGLIVATPAVMALANTLANGCGDAREYLHAVWRWLMLELTFGDWHRDDMDEGDPLGWLLRTRRADCYLGSSLLIALCRARGIPARMVTGFLIHPANIGPHSWAEVRLAPGLWVPFDFGSWCYSAGNPDDPKWGSFYRGRVDARFLAETAPREFTGWGSAPPPDRWYRLESLDGERIVHTLHSLPDNRLFRRDTLNVSILGPACGASDHLLAPR
jgi:hypothetical protein